MENADYLTNLTKFYTLALLEQKPRHGYEIMDELEERTGKRPSTGQIYPMLREFEEKNLVKSEKKEVEGRERKIYELTEKGQETFKKISNKFNDLITTILESKLTECDHCGCEIFNGEHDETIDGEKKVFCCENCAKAYKELDIEK